MHSICRSDEEDCKLRYCKTSLDRIWRRKNHIIIKTDWKKGLINYSNTSAEYCMSYTFYFATPNSSTMLSTDTAPILYITFNVSTATYTRWRLVASSLKLTGLCGSEIYEFRSRKVLPYEYPEALRFKFQNLTRKPDKYSTCILSVQFSHAESNSFRSRDSWRNPLFSFHYRNDSHVIRHV